MCVLSTHIELFQSWSWTGGGAHAGTIIRTSWLQLRIYLAARVDEGAVGEHVGDNTVRLHLIYDALPALPRPGLATLDIRNAGGEIGARYGQEHEKKK